MNVKKALKTKSKLIASITENYGRVVAYNSAEDNSERAYDPKEALTNMMATIDEVIELKVKIHKANSKVYDKIFRLSELKSLAKQIKQINCNTGKVRNRYASHEENPPVYTAIISVQERDALVKKIEEEIEQIQEVLDTHNSKTKI